MQNVIPIKRGNLQANRFSDRCVTISGAGVFQNEGAPDDATKHTQPLEPTRRQHSPGRGLITAAVILTAGFLIWVGAGALIGLMLGGAG